MPFLAYKTSKVHYTRFGEGPKLLIALHGFADTGQIFEVLSPALAADYRIIAIDLPFHGKTVWHEAEFTPKDILLLIQQIAEQEKETSYALMGHSLGARLILKILPDLIYHIEKLYLLAPDGLHNKWIFNMNLVPTWLRRFLQKKLENPLLLFRITDWLHRKGLLSTLAKHFVAIHMKDAYRRNRLFGTWLSLRHFMTFPHQIQSFLRKHKIPTILIYGKKDRIVRPEWGTRFARNLPHVKLYWLDSHHQLVNEQLAVFLKKCS